MGTGIRDGQSAEMALFRAELADLLALDRDLLGSWEAELIESLSWRLVDGLPIGDRWIAKVRRMWELNCL